MDPKTAPAAIKTATDALAGLTVGQVWTRTAPHGEPQVQASLMFQNKEVARLEFDPADGSLLTRGQHVPPPPAPGDPAAGPRDNRGLAARPNPPVPTDRPEAPAMPAPGNVAPGDIPPPPAPVSRPPGATANLDQVKTHLPEIIKSLSVGQGAEVMPREGFWKVPLIHQNRVVGELRLSGDGTRVIQDFGASRDAAIFGR